MGKSKKAKLVRTTEVPVEGMPTIEELAGVMSARDYSMLKKAGNVDGIAERLRTSTKEGLTEDDNGLEARREYYGPNRYPMPPSPSWFAFFWEACGDTAVRILTAAAIVALIGGTLETVLAGHDGAWIDGVAIIVAVLIVTVVGSTNDYMKEQQFRNLNEKASSEKEQRVIRNGQDTKINLGDVVVGDIIPLFAGDQVPADGLFVSTGEELACDESSMTGEPDQKTKDRRHPFILSGTFVTKGAGRLLVLQIGELSEWGQLLKNLQPNNEVTPLQAKLEDVVVFIGKVGLAVAVATFIVLFGYWVADYAVAPYYRETECNVTTQPDPTNNFDPRGRPYCNYTAFKQVLNVSPPKVYVEDSEFQPNTLLYLLTDLIVAITIVVVAVPEGLPLAVLISLAYSMREMLKDMNLVRHLQACEIMGGATDICSDKTGTLTENRMTVVSGWMAGESFDKVSELKLKDPLKTALAESLCVNTNDGRLTEADKADLPKDVTSASELSGWKFIGSPTECALLVMAHRLGYKYEELQEQYPTVYRWNFSSARKRMSTIVNHKVVDAKKGGYRLYMKGASEIVLKLCKNMLMEDGTTTKLRTKTKKQLQTEIDTLAGKGLRTIGLAYRDFTESKDWSVGGEEGNQYEEDLTLVALVGIEDPLREAVPGAVKTCQRAGITVRMVTGDNIITAKKIAEDCHIFDPEKGIALEGPEFNEMTDDEVFNILDDLQVLARSKPNDKHRLVTLLKQKGRVVAGDGTNDGPALRAADVGLAMGIAGTEVAREAADIIILDDNFASIVKSVLWGRCVFDNIRKFLQFQLTINVVALLVAFISAVSRRGTPLTAIQLLWVNLIMDTLAALALGTEKPIPELLNRKPYGRKGRLITWTMWRNIIGQSIFQCAVLFTIIYSVESSAAGDGEKNHLIWPQMVDGIDANEVNRASDHYTMVFNTFVFLQIFNEFNARKVGPREMNIFKGLFTNWLFLAILFFIIGVQLILVFFGGDVMKTTPLNYDWVLWLSSIGIALFSIPLGFLLRLIPMKREFWEYPAEGFEDD